MIRHSQHTLWHTQPRQAKTLLFALHTSCSSQRSNGPPKLHPELFLSLSAQVSCTRVGCVAAKRTTTFPTFYCWMMLDLESSRNCVQDRGLPGYHQGNLIPGPFLGFGSHWGTLTPTRIPMAGDCDSAHLEAVRRRYWITSQDIYDISSHPAWMLMAHDIITLQLLGL